MALPKKNSRLIEVNGRSYRWMAKKTQDPTRVRLTVQDEATGEIHQRTVSGWDGSPNVTPGVAREFILERFV